MLYENVNYHLYYTDHNIDYFLEGQSIFKKIYDLILKEEQERYCQLRYDETYLLNCFNFALRNAILLNRIKYPSLNLKVNIQNWDAWCMTAILLKLSTKFHPSEELENCHRRIAYFLDQLVNDYDFECTYSLLRFYRDVDLETVLDLTPNPDWNFINAKNIDISFITNKYQDREAIVELINLMPYKEDKLRLLDMIDRDRNAIYSVSAPVPAAFAIPDEYNKPDKDPDNGDLPF